MLNIIVFLTITIIVTFQDAISLKKQKRRDVGEKTTNDEDLEKISYSDNIYAPYKPGKEFKEKPDIKHPGSCNKFLLVSESTSSSIEIKTRKKQKKSTNRNQNTNDIIIDNTNDTLKNFLQSKQTDENRIKDEMKAVYKKLAEDFQVLQDLLEKEKYSIYGNLSVDSQNFIKESKLKDANNTSNILTIEDVNSNNGPLTRITLLRRNIVEKKSDLDLPVISSERSGLNNKYVKLKIEREDEEAM
ncbi:uncharacterized protein [Halyomorpha halys]|uniref:uncharacterized protein n=1 Tax=Halyomorpha halys TaxID=286706 RepID=UPI0006D50E22|nr:uncharacterized protein LOC106688089 isoform X2 [Halyomorpha halys]